MSETSIAASLIAYQRQRRSYMLSEDRITLSIRQNWRQLQVQEYRLEIDRTDGQKCRVAVRQRVVTGHRSRSNERPQRH